MSTRDTQRSRLYAAENAADIHGRRSERAKRLLLDTETNPAMLTPYPSVQSVQAYVDSLRTSATFQRRWGYVGVTVSAGHGHTSRGGRGTMSISALHRLDEAVLLHEVAHNLVPEHHGGWHGPVFAATLLTLVDLFIGKPEAAALRAEYVAHRVKYRTGMAKVPKPSAETLARARRVHVKVAKPTSKPILAARRATR